MHRSGKRLGSNNEVTLVNENTKVLSQNLSFWQQKYQINMGRRRSKRKAEPKKKREPLDVQFNCPFCNHEKSCEVKIDRVKNLGYISCRVCLETFQSTVTYLSEPVDVYSDWIDACELANQ